MSRPSDRVAFFLAHAGFSYKLGATPAEISASELANAENLARAEMTAESLGWTVDYEFEHETWDGEGESPAYLLCVLVRDSQGECLDSVGMVGVDSMSDPYLRVVAAEIFEQAIDQRATEQATELASRATFAAGGNR